MPPNLAPSFTSGTTFEVAENSNTTILVTASDPNEETLTFAIAGGDDAALFTINPETGALAFIASPNFEAPTDAGLNNIYDIQLSVTDGVNPPVTQNITVTVTNVNETPAIISNGGGASAPVSVAENQTAVTTINAADPDAGSTLTYSITGGDDAALFSINSNTGVLTFVSAPNFEAPIGGDNVYDVTVQVSDGSLVDSQAIVVTVTDVNEAPTALALQNVVAALAENANTASGIDLADLVVSDDALGSETFAVTGPDQAAFEIIGTKLRLKAGAVLDFETKPTYSITVTVNDPTVGGSPDASVPYTLTITDVDEIAPTVTVNQAAGQVDPTTVSPIDFTVVFSEPVLGFLASDLSFAGSTAPGTLVATISGSGPTYTVSVTGMTGSGSVVLSLPANRVTDAAGNANTASTSTDNTVTYNHMSNLLVIDDGDPGFAAVANLTHYSGTGGGGAGTDGFNGDMDFDPNTASGGATVATWTSTPLPSGVYRVSVTWPGDPNRSPQVTYTVSSTGSSATQSQTFNQIYAPNFISGPLGINNGANGFVSERGKIFTDIGPDYLMGIGGTITVTLRDNAPSGFAIADAVRIERVADLPAIDITVLDGAATLVDGAALSLGSGVTGGPSVQKTLTLRNDGAGPGTLNLSALSVTGPFSASTPASTTLAAGASTTVTVTLPTSTAGTFTGTLSIPSNDPDEAAFSLSLSGTIAAPVTTIIVDDGDPGFTAHTTLYHYGSVGYASTVAEVGLLDFRFDLANVGNGENIASWTSGTLTPGYYRVSATWLGDGNRSPDVTYHLTGGAAPTSASFNQQVTPSAFDAGGVNWADIAASYVVTSAGPLTVTLVDNAAAGFAFADAIRFERIGDLTPVDIRISDGATELPQSGTLNLGTAAQLTPTLTKTITIKNDGLTGALNLGTLSSTGPFLVSTPSVTVLNPGESTTLTVQLPTTGTGTQTGTLSIPSNDPDENPFVLNLTGTIAPIGGIIDDGDAGYTAVATLTRYVGTGSGGAGSDGYNGDLEFDYGTASNGQTVATWTSAILPAGTYRVSATWPGDPNRSSQVTYTVTNSATAATQSQSFNQLEAPNSALNGVSGWVVDGGKIFTDIGNDYVLATDGTITVTLVDDASFGFAIADAIRFERLGPPQLALGGQATSAGVATVTTSDLQNVFAAALDIVRNTPRGQLYASVLQNVTLQVQDLSAGVLGTVSGQTIILDTNAAGHGWFIDPTPFDNAEFTAPGLVASAISPASNRMDALTTLVHELGHILGLHDQLALNTPMTAQLPPGTRRLPTLDTAFASLVDVSL